MYDMPPAIAAASIPVSRWISKMMLVISMVAQVARTPVQAGMLRKRKSMAYMNARLNIAHSPNWGISIGFMMSKMGLLPVMSPKSNISLSPSYMALSFQDWRPSFLLPFAAVGA